MFCPIAIKKENLDCFPKCFEGLPSTKLTKKSILNKMSGWPSGLRRQTQEFLAH
jgi:hypothetical protein